MTNFKTRILWTIVLNFFIIIGAGHGIGSLGLLEIVGLFELFNIGTEDFTLSLVTSYEKSLSAATFFAFFGHILLIISLIAKGPKLKFWASITGLPMLWISFYYLTHNLFTDNVAQVSFVTGLPFLFVSIILVYKVLRQKRHTA